MSLGNIQNALIEIANNLLLPLVLLSVVSQSILYPIITSFTFIDTFLATLFIGELTLWIKTQNNIIKKILPALLLGALLYLLFKDKKESFSFAALKGSLAGGFAYLCVALTYEYLLSLPNINKEEILCYQLVPGYKYGYDQWEKINKLLNIKRFCDFIKPFINPFKKVMPSWLFDKVIKTTNSDSCGFLDLLSQKLRIPKAIDFFSKKLKNESLALALVNNTLLTIIPFQFIIFEVVKSFFYVVIPPIVIITLP